MNSEQKEKIIERFANVLLHCYGQGEVYLNANIRREVNKLIQQVQKEDEEENFAASRLLFDRLMEWNKEWQAEKPKERALTHHDSKRLIDWKINKSVKDDREKIIAWAEKYVEIDMKSYGTDKYGISLEDLINCLRGKV